MAKKISSLYTNLMKPLDIINIHEIDPSIKVRLSYATEDNFTGLIIPGYKSINKAYLIREAALALSQIQKKLASFGLELFIFDAYRPQKAVNFFHHWGKDETAPGLKNKFFPNLTKQEIFDQEFIAKKSRHNRASAVDLSLMEKDSGLLLDMGTIFDFFGEESHTAYPRLTSSQQKNRQFLLEIMQEAHFENFPKEWWHFNFHLDPYYNQVLDFDIS